MKEEKIKTVKLSSKNGQRKDETFNIEHARNILKRQDKTGRKDWILTDKEVTYKDGEFRSKPSSTDSKG